MHAFRRNFWGFKSVSSICQSYFGHSVLLSTSESLFEMNAIVAPRGKH
jgi:hypothetical protein